jgi:hypothetical protein
MTQVATGEQIVIAGSAFQLQEIDCSPGSILAAEFAGKLVLAQQVHAADGTPFTIPVPSQIQFEVSLETWEAHIHRLREQTEAGTSDPLVTIPPYLGMVHALGEKASYFSLERFDTHTTAILPFHTVHPKGGKASRFRLYTAS